MIAFSIRCLTFAGLLSAAFLAIARWIPPDPVETSFLFALRDKQALLATTRPAAVLLVGGSNVAFGFDSPLLSQRIGRPVINQGLHAGTGIDLMIDQIDTKLIRGDHVVLMFEYELWNRGEIGSPAIAATLIDVAPSLRSSFGTLDRIRLLDDMLPYLGRKSLAFTRKHLNQWIGRTVENAGLEIYHREKFNDDGDLVSHWQRDSLPVACLEAPKSFEVDSQRVDRVARWIDSLSQRGVVVSMMPPVLEQQSFKSQAKMIEKIAAALEERGIGYALEPKCFQNDASHFFDTPHHLTRKGIEWRMDLMAGPLSK